MDRSEELILKIAYASYRGINLSSARRLEAVGIGPGEFFSQAPATLAAMTGLRKETFSGERRDEALSKARAEYNFITGSNIRPIYYTDSRYPRRLAECDDAPVMLYLLGEEELNFRHIVSVVGTRHSTAYGIDFTSKLVRDLAAKLDSLLIVSGLAYGIDIAAHRAAMAEGVPTCAVLAHGLNTIYPADHRDEARRIVREGGNLVTEYRSTDPIHRGNFLARNRIVAALADVTIVVESDLHGGAMSTASIAGAYNREVMAVPGRVHDTYSRGCNDLIASQRASMIRDAEDVLTALGWNPEKVPEGSQKELGLVLTPEQEEVIAFIKANPEATVNDMCAGMGLSYSRLSSLLFDMEMNDVLIALPGGRYGVISC